MKFTLRRRKDTRSWEVDWFENGKRRRRSLGRITKYLAEQKISKMQHDMLLGKSQESVYQSTDLESFF